MQKPISVAKYAFENDLADLINSSGLPMFVVEYVLKDMIVAVKNNADKQLKADIEKYKQNIQVVKADVPDEKQI